MRTLLLAFVTGLALAGAMLGLGGQSLAHTEFRAEPDQRALLPAAATPTDDRAAVRTPTPGTHSDANSSAVTVRLNMNLIRGEPTRVCTTDPDVYPKLEAAISIWRTALRDLITVQGADGPFLLHRSLSGRPQTCPVSGPNDVDVLVRKSAEPGRAYYFNRQDSPPRKLFAATDDYIPESIRSEHHAVISLNSSLEVLTSTLVHELGHVLGLSDYTVCGLLHDLDTATTDPDPTDQHYALMYNAPDRECRPQDQEMITDRDLRDLYEAYHVGAVTHVRVPWYTSSVQLAMNPSISGNTLRFTVHWGDGIDEAAHNASEVAVFGNYADIGWMRLGSVSVPETGPLMPGLRVSAAKRRPEADPIVNPDPEEAWPYQYKVVGLTSGDIRWEGRRLAQAGEPHIWAFDRAACIGVSSGGRRPDLLGRQARAERRGREFTAELEREH